jgi:hypothetical protein
MVHFTFRFDSKETAHKFLDWLFCFSEARFGYCSQRDNMDIGPFKLCSGEWLVKFVTDANETARAAIKAAANGNFASTGCWPEDGCICSN